jgi:hypothetical protein
MQEVTLNLMTAEAFYHARVSPRMAKRVFAALSADPWTLEDLTVALGRYIENYPKRGSHVHWLPGLACPSETDSVLCMDLVAQQAASQRIPWKLDDRGTVPFSASRLQEWESKGVVQIPFHLAGTWCFCADVKNFRDYALAKRDFTERGSIQKARKFLYGNFPQFAFPRILCGIRLLRSLQDDGCEDVLQRVHGDWFSRRFVELDGVCFRDWIRQVRSDHIVEDLGNQAFRWLTLNQPPPPIARNSYAYGNSGFGLHEATLFFGYQRAMLHEGMSRAFQTVHGPLNMSLEIEHLRQFGQDWLHRPDDLVLHGQTPASMIDNERRRMPEVVPEDERAVDADCRGCAPVDEEDLPVGPTFVHLEMDDEMRQAPFDFRFDYAGVRSRTDYLTEPQSHGDA